MPILGLSKQQWANQRVKKRSGECFRETVRAVLVGLHVGKSQDACRNCLSNTVAGNSVVFLLELAGREATFFTAGKFRKLDSQIAVPREIRKKTELHKHKVEEINMLKERFLFGSCAMFKE